MHITQNILGLLIVLLILVPFHELGHFLAARLFRFPVEIFSLGFGPKIFGFRRKETEYRVSWIPLGGYVKIAGMGMDETKLGKPDGAFETGTRGQRFLILLGGPFVNLVLAVLLVAGSFMLGIQIPAYLEREVRVGYVDPDSPAGKAGIRVGDVLTALDRGRVRTWEDLLKSVTISGGERVSLSVLRDGGLVEMPVQLTRRGEYQIGYLGIVPPAPAKILTVEKDGPAGKAGVRPGDILKALDGQPIHHPLEAFPLIAARGGRTVALEIEREGRILTLDVEVAVVEGKGRMGVVLPTFPEEYTTRKYGFFAALGRSAASCWSDATLAYRFIRKLLAGKGSARQMSGIVDMAKFSGEAMRSGFVYFLNFLGLISLQLAIFNLLPIPLLDGGHMFILAIEAVLRRSFSLDVKLRIAQVGFLFLILLVGTVTVLDIMKNL
jgi:regulator of sigma E protease